MQDKLQWVEARYDELSQQMAQPETTQDPALLSKLMREHAQLEPVVETYRELCALKAQKAEPRRYFRTRSLRTWRARS